MDAVFHDGLFVLRASVRTLDEWTHHETQRYLRDLSEGLCGGLAMRDVRLSDMQNPDAYTQRVLHDFDERRERRF